MQRRNERDEKFMYFKGLLICCNFPLVIVLSECMSEIEQDPLLESNAFT